MNNEILAKLKAPFPVEKLSWRIGQKSKDKTKAMMLVYIDARDVQDRLDEVCGMDWSNKFESVNGRTICSITIHGQTRSDGAGDTDFEAEKGGLSDAFKRAAVQWGIGRYLYDAKQFNTWVNCADMPDWDIYKNNKHQLDTVASMLGKKVSTYKHYLEAIDNAKTKEEFERLKIEAREKAASEMWSMGNIGTIKEHIEKKEASFK